MVQHPTRTSIGIAGGIVVATLVDMMKPFLTAINVAALTDFRLAVCGVFASNAPLLFKKNVLPEAIEQEFAGVRKAVAEGKLSAAHQKLLYLKIAHNAIDGAMMSRKLAEEVADVEHQAGAKARRPQHGGPKTTG